MTGATSEPTPDPGGEVPAWFRRLSRMSWGFLGMVGAAAVIVFGLSWLRELTIPLILASFFAVVAAPAVDWLEARRVPRSLGASIVILGVAAAVVGAITVVVVGVVDQADELADRFDEAQTEIRDLIEQSDLSDTVDRIRESAETTGPVARDGLGAEIGTFLDSAAGFASGIVLGTVLLYYLLKDGGDIVAKAVASRDAARSAQNQRIVGQAGTSIRGYFRGKTALALVQGVFIAVVVAIMGVPLAGSIGVVNFIGAYIPFLGAFVGGAFAMLMALSEGGLGLALVVLVVVLVANLLIENLLEPRLLGSSLELHPIVVLLATVAGGVVAGMVGLILAAPLTAIGINLFRELEDSGFFGDRDSDPESPGVTPADPGAVDAPPE